MKSLKKLTVKIRYTSMYGYWYDFYFFCLNHSDLTHLNLAFDVMVVLNRNLDHLFGGKWSNPERK